MIILVCLILLIFSIIWFCVWFWFFKGSKSFSNKVRKALDTYLEKGNYVKAKNLLLRMPDLATNPDNKCKLGITHLKLNEYDEAKACFEQVLKTSPKNFDALFNLAQVLHSQKKYDEALDLYMKAANEQDKDINCPLNIGLIYYDQGNYSKALETLEKAKELSPDNVQVLFSIAKCKNELCNFDNEEEVNKLINEYIKLDGCADLPADFNISLAKLYAKTGEIDKALEYCQNAVDANGEDIEAFRLLGLIQLINREFSNAKGSLSAALNFQTDSAETHNLFSYLFCSHEEGCALQKCRQKYYELIKKHLSEQ